MRRLLRPRSDLHHGAGSAVYHEVGSRDPVRLVGGEVEAGIRNSERVAGLAVDRALDHRGTGALSPNSSNIASTGGVAMTPGLTELTRTPTATPSAASCRVSAMTAPFAAEWAACGRARAPWIPAPEPMLTIAPPTAARCGQATLAGVPHQVEFVADREPVVLAAHLGEGREFRHARVVVEHVDTAMPFDRTADPALDESRLARSTGALDSIEPPSSSTRRTVSAALVASRSQPTTVAPSPANSRAVTRPMPPPMPVNRTTLPSRRHPAMFVLRSSSLCIAAHASTAGKGAGGGAADACSSCTVLCTDCTMGSRSAQLRPQMAQDEQTCIHTAHRIKGDDE